MSDDPRLAEVRRQLRRPASLDDILIMLPVLDELVAGTSPKVAQEGKELLIQAFESLRELTAGEPDRAATILIHDLLPRCLLPDQVKEDFGDRPCYTFGKWLDNLPEDRRGRVRAEALPRTLASLDGPSVRNSIRLISGASAKSPDARDGGDAG